MRCREQLDVVEYIKHNFYSNFVKINLGDPSRWNLLRISQTFPIGSLHSSQIINGQSLTYDSCLLEPNPKFLMPLSNIRSPKLY